MTFAIDDRPLPADCETMADVRKGVDALDAALADIAAYVHEQALQSLRTPRS